MSRVAWALLIGGLALVLGYMVWGLFSLIGFGSWTGGSKALLIIVIAGVVGTGALTALLMQLTFASARNGFDEAPEIKPGDTCEEIATSRHPSDNTIARSS